MDEDILLPEDEVKFDDTRPYHEVEMYKKMVRYQIGLLTRAIILNKFKDKIPPVNTLIKGSFPKKEEIKENYSTCTGNREIIFPIEEDVDYIFLGNFACYVMGCERRINVFKRGRIMFICSEQGNRYLDIRNYKSTYGEENMYGEKDTVLSYERFGDMLKELKEHLINTSQLVLIGHSNGMASSILTAFLICCMRNYEFYTRHSKSFDDRMLIFVKNLIQNEKEIYEALERITLYVVGSGGFPVLFESQEEFKDFYNEIKGRYVHIVDGKKDENGNILVDYYASPIASLINIKYGLYYNDDIVIPKNKYEGIQCFYGIIIDDINMNGWQKIDNIQRPYFVNTNTKEVTWTPVPLLLSTLENKYPELSFLDLDSKNSALIHMLSFYRDILSIYFFS
jgi:hypothetical protein